MSGPMKTNSLARPEAQTRGHRVALGSALVMFVIGASMVIYAGRKWKLAGPETDLVPLQLLTAVGGFFTLAALGSVSLGCRVGRISRRHLLGHTWKMARWANHR
jgi:hypothetical protein